MYCSVYICSCTNFEPKMCSLETFLRKSDSLADTGTCTMYMYMPKEIENVDLQVDKKAKIKV